MKMIRQTSVVLALAALLFTLGCNRAPGSKLTRENYDKITVGMQKPQVETILGPPTTIETKPDMIIFKKTTWRYEEGDRFAMINFKNDEVEGKDTNLGR
jgi:outer membrane protein assembly factor BamE (lipoprotein component of BamABCDE complex)